VPQAGNGGFPDGGGLAAAGDGSLGERRGGGRLGQEGSQVAFLPGPTAPADVDRRQLIQRSVLTQPGGPGGAAREFFSPPRA
jgi:hypothetical protein